MVIHYNLNYVIVIIFFNVFIVFDNQDQTRTIDGVESKVIANELTFIIKDLILIIDRAEIITLMVKPHLISPVSLYLKDLFKNKKFFIGKLPKCNCAFRIPEKNHSTFYNLHS